MGTGAQLAMLPWFVRDYIAATRQLSLAERGAYTDLLFFQWELGGLPLAIDRLARLIGCSSEEFAAVWPAILSKFVESNGVLLNTRLEEHRVKSKALSAKRAIAGHAGGKQSGKQRASKSEAIASSLLGGLPVAKSNSPSPSPSPSPIPDQSPSETCPLERTATAKPAYQGKEFHDQVIAAYHEALPDLPAVKIWSPDRVKSLNARIRERCSQGKPADTAEYWQRLFAKAAQNDHWCGRKADSTWCANLEWFLKPTNFAKVIEWEPRRGNGADHAR